MKVTYKDHMGTDLSVVNAARVSFGKESEWANGGSLSADIWPNLTDGEKALNGGVLSEADKGLVGFLARGCTSGEWNHMVEFMGIAQKAGKHIDIHPDENSAILTAIRRMPPHWTPFGHTSISLHMKLPLFVTRQINKHQVGFVINEVSRRYVSTTPEFYNPKGWRMAAENVKQGSNDECFDGYFYKEAENGVDIGIERVVEYEQERVIELYDDMISKGICAEQARMILPQSMYTEFWMTGNLYGWANLYNQRSDPHAQREVQEVARQIGEIIEPLYPESWKALTN